MMQVIGVAILKYSDSNYRACIVKKISPILNAISLIKIGENFLKSGSYFHCRLLQTSSKLFFFAYSGNTVPLLLGM